MGGEITVSYTYPALYTCTVLPFHGKIFRKIDDQLLSTNSLLYKYFLLDEVEKL